MILLPMTLVRVVAVVVGEEFSTAQMVIGVAVTSLDPALPTRLDFSDSLALVGVRDFRVLVFDELAVFALAAAANASTIGRLLVGKSSLSLHRWRIRSHWLLLLLCEDKTHAEGVEPLMSVSTRQITSHKAHQQLRVDNRVLHWGGKSLSRELLRRRRHSGGGRSHEAGRGGARQLRAASLRRREEDKGVQGGSSTNFGE